MVPNPAVMKAVEQLNYRATVGDVAAQAGLDIKVAQRELLALASDAGGHLQVAESGDIAYQFSKDFRTILRNKYFRLQLQEWWQKVWRVLFYLIRISFGIVLVALIALTLLAIIAIVMSLNRDGDGDSSSDSDSGSGFGLPRVWITPDLFWFFDPGYGYEARPERQQSESGMNFFVAIFSFLFGDGNPNAILEERRWKLIATTIRNHQGAVVAEQIAPYLDELGDRSAQSTEDYMLPVLLRFDGRPEVSQEGGLIYHFPELQTMAAQTRTQSVAAYLKEMSWRFSLASSGQIMGAIALGGTLLVLSLVLGSLIAEAAVSSSLFVLLFRVSLGYSAAFLTIPLVRYFWVQWRNAKVNARNEQRQARAIALNRATPELQHKLDYARTFAAETVVDAKNLAYTTESDLIEQDIERKDQIDAEWQRRLEARDS
ncbi:hypothetical protein [Geitlerinema sp. PCC 7407]|uniref:hypothetical protein n=1 Tax=Geitlerinema sp. PCC 7407 TaxID=1173025 RepID=UPI00029FB373|nr:hypothetical protein [Geitlerinema sp. PCC 7407]AFY65311.1 hypothetical protein GEI7407_0813 [Geitlerinema sp. PCC 7407]